MLKRYFISNIAVMVLLNFLVKPFYIFEIDRTVQNVVGYEEYGLYGALLTISIIFNILLDLGITNFNNKSLAEDPKLINKYLPNMLAAKAFLSLVFMVVILIVGFSLGYGERGIRLLGLIALIQILNSALLFLRSNVSANHDFKIDGFLSVLDKLLMIIICGSLLFISHFREQFIIEWFVYAQLFSFGISVLIALGVVLFRYTKINFSFIQFDVVKKLLRQSLPYAALIFLMGIYIRSDSVLLERLLDDGEYQNGVYLSAFRILDAFNMFGILFAGILLPMFSRMFSKQNKVKDLVRMTANILIPISLVIAANAIFFNNEIMNILYEKNTAVGSSIYCFVMLSFPAYCVMHIYSTLLTAKGSLKLLIGIALVASLISITANVILIPQYKAISVAWVAIGVQWFAALAYIFYSIRETDIQYNWAWVAQFAAFFLVFGMLNYFLKALEMNVVVSIALNVLIFLPLVFLLKLWDWKEMTKYFQEIVVKDKQ